VEEMDHAPSKEQATAQEEEMDHAPSKEQATAQDQDNSSAPSEDPAMALNHNTSPKQTSAHPCAATVSDHPSTVFLQRYKRIYDEQINRLLSGLRPRLFIFRHQDGTGYGNRLRAIQSLFLFSVLTNRIMVVDEVDFDVHFDNPSGFKMKWSDFAGSLPEGMSEARHDMGGIIDMCRNLDGDKDFETMFPEDIQVYGDGNSPDQYMFQTPSFYPKLNETFGTYSRFQITGIVSSFFLSRPSLRFQTQIERVKREMKWNEYKYHISLQFRAFVDAGQHTKHEFPEFVKLAEEKIDIILKEKQWAPSEVAIWFSSDDQELMDRFEDELTITRNRVVVLHSTQVPSHTSALAGGSVKHPIIEWYLFGESE
jgi:hypothetical protein